MSLVQKGRWITLTAFVLLAGVYVRALAFTPVERFQGPAQKIFYVHVPAAWSAMLAMALVGLCSILYLILKDPRFDRFAAASAEVGTAFSLVMLTTGPIWAKPIWGTWWTWDARLTLTLFLFFLFLGYLLLRGAVGEPGLRARYSAVLGICGLLLACSRCCTSASWCSGTRCRCDGRSRDEEVVEVGAGVEDRVSEVPQNAGYMVAAYVVTAVILLGYAVSLYRRSMKL